MPAQLQFLTAANFGQVVTGTTATIQVSIQNFGDEDCLVTAINVDVSLGYGSPTSVPFNIAPGETVTGPLQWTAGTVGVTPASTVDVISNAIQNPLSEALTSESVAAGVKTVAASPSSFLFANTKVGVDSAVQVFVVTNTGTVDVAVSGSTFPTGFAAAAPIPAYPVTLHAGDTMSIGAKFHPAGQGYVSDDMEVASDAASTPLHITLSGTGYLINPAYIASGEVVLLAAFGNTVLQFDALDFDCEEDGFVARDVNLTMPGLEDSFLQMQLNHEAKGASTLTLTVENQRSQTASVDIDLSAATNDKIRSAFGNMNSSISGEVLTVTLTHEASGGPAAITSYVLRSVPAGEVKPA